ncbi:MAG: bifunctional enoyl-CoA hydratase/phosphate acetyltransferase [Bacteroidales bacterium]|nr:bifunctional enoyl-CoA hydratase/phosphate acetyltransferase [Bacteroidales bacterium]
MLKTLSQITDLAKSKTKRRLAVAAADDKHVLEAVKKAQEEGIIEAVLVGNMENIEKIALEIDLDLSNIELHDEKNAYKASVKAVELIREGKAEILMKGLVSTGPLMKAVLDKEKGLRKGGTLSHVAFFESPYYHKLLGVTDAAMNVAPEFAEKVDIIKNAVEAFNKLGYEKPKVAVVGAVETVNLKMEATTDAAILTMMNKRGQIKGCVIDGPLALDNAVSKESAKQKKVESEVAGDVDLIVTPDIEAGNILYKSMNFIGGATTAAVIMGAQVPIVLTSRADSEKSKMMSISLAAAIG